MTALLQARDTKQVSGPIAASVLVPRNFPVAAATTIWSGSMVGTDASGNAVPASASTAIRIWGRAEKTIKNTVAEGFGVAGDLRIDVMPGVHAMTNGTGVDAITSAHVGQICYASDDQVVNLTDGAGLRPAAGRIEGLLGTEVKVALGEPSLWDESDTVETARHIKTVFARNVVNGNVADLAAYTVASNAAVNDATLNVEGDIVLLIAQSTAAQNGLYRVGVVSGGLAPLTRIAPMPAGYVYVADEFEIAVRVGTVFAHTKWFNSAGGTIATDSPAFMPESVTLTQALVAGAMTLTSVPVLSATRTGVKMTRSTANTCVATDGGYVLNGNPTAGALGTASIPIMASVLAGTINVADISTLHVTITNR